MKHLVIIFALILSGFSVYAKDETKVSPAVLENFRNSFKSATEVNWTVGENHYKAEFHMNGQFVSAYFDYEGRMIAISRNISSLQLPLTLQTSLKNHYENYWITELFEVANDEGTSYYVTIETGETKLILKASAGSDWFTYKKLRKS